MATLRTSAFVGDLSGKTGNAVFVRTKFGTVLRERPRSGGDPSPAQRSVRARMRQACAAYRALSVPQIEAWRAYAWALASTGTSRGGQAPKSGQQLFIAFATKILQIDPGAQIPADPPAAPFPGDGVRFSVQPILGGVRVTADGPNHPGAATELLVQPLPSLACRTYLSRFRTARFVRFAPGALTVDLPCGPGAVAVAARFVEPATGRMMEIVEMGSLAVST